MSYAVKHKAQLRYICSGVFFLLAVVLLIICVRHEPEARQVQASYDTQQRIVAQIANENKATSSLSEKVNGTGKTFESLAGKKDASLSYLGDLATVHRLNIHKLTAEDVKEVEGSTISYMPFEVEVQGDLANIEAFCADLYKSDRIMTIQQFSYRLDGQTYRWMWRAIDNHLLLSWWDIADYQSKSATDDTSTADAAALSDLTVSALMQHSTALCYIQLNMIGG